MKTSTTPSWLRGMAVLLAAGLTFTLGGDRGFTALLPGVGIDPLQILDLQIKPNVLVVVDTSGSMRFPPNTSIGGTEANLNIGGDDPVAKMYKAKEALKAVLDANRNTINFGIAQYGVRNTQKILTQPSFTDVNQSVGPLTYVSLDAAADIWTGGPSGTGGGDFFVSSASTAINYLGTSSLNVYRSFRPFNEVFPGSGCTAGTNCRRYLFSRLLRDDVKFTWDRASGSGGLQAGSPSTISCPLPPVGIFPQDANTDGDATRTDIPRPCFQVESTVAADGIATFYYTSGTWEGTISSCTPSWVLQNVAPCASDTVNAIKEFLKPEFPIDGSCGDTVGIPCGMENGGTNYINNTTTEFQGTQPAGTGAPPNAETRLGLLAAQATPLGGVLIDVRNNVNTYFPNRIANQRNFVLMLTDGDETCSGDPATQAQTNWDNNPRIETLVIGFGLNTATLNQIARNGSGGTLDAYTADTTQELIDALNAALQQTTIAGAFADQQTITDSIYELVYLVPSTPPAAPFTPRDPQTRYGANLPILLQSTFDMPSFNGHLKAFRNVANVSTLVWDAGQKLTDRITTGMSGGPWSFAVLHDGATLTNIGGSNAKIKRRIITTNRNGVNPSNVALWPPDTGDTGVAPSGNANPPGSHDQALAIDTMTFAEMQAAPYFACRGSNLPPACADVSNRDAIARRELREMILAKMAGADPVRNTTSGYPQRFSSGSNRYKIQYTTTASTWGLADATLSAPAIVSPPTQTVSEVHSPEYTLFRDGPRTGTGVAIDCIAQGFGLRNPDNDGTAASKLSDTLKPQMTVAYLGANDMLHAFRAGPCVSSSGSNQCVGGTVETGGEELWGFVPFDMLGKLKLRMNTPTRADHVYMLASPIRIADVFVPGAFSTSCGSTTVTGSGKWRTVIMFGRGVGGTHYTALDVTVPGQFTKASLATNIPTVLWNRGNPDTTLGVNGGVENYTTNSNVDLGEVDTRAYATMGMTWSSPTTVRIRTTTPSSTNNFGKEFVTYVGSGYSTVASQGHNVYVIDPVTGDILQSADVGSSTSGSSLVQNKVVASPSGYEPTLFGVGTAVPPMGLVDRVYVPDLHGRVWKFLTSDPSTGILYTDRGVDQPIATAAAILGIESTGVKAHVFVESGYDYRIPAPPATPPPPVFEMFGFRDDTTDSDDTAVNMEPLFDENLLSVNGALQFGNGFRGTVQPATAFANAAGDAAGRGRVFFAGTKFNPPSAANANPCLSTFDSEIWAVGAETGGAAYDLNLSGSEDAGDADLKLTLTDQRVNAIQSAFGRLIVDKGLHAEIPPPPPEPPQNVASGSSDVFVRNLRTNSPVCK